MRTNRTINSVIYLNTPNSARAVERANARGLTDGVADLVAAVT
jgi:hypothetical protein